MKKQKVDQGKTNLDPPILVTSSESAGMLGVKHHLCHGATDIKYTNTTQVTVEVPELERQGIITIRK